MKSFIRLLVHERVVFTLILLNSITLFLNAFDSIQGRFYNELFTIDYIITIYFVLEISLKLFFEKWQVFWSKGWNIFDFIIVTLSSPILFAPLIGSDEFSFLIIFRLLRILRYFRLLRFIPDRQHIAIGIIRSLKASIGVFLIVLLYNFILSLSAVYLFRDVAPGYFDNPFMAIYAVFRVFTVEGWYEIPELIAANSSDGFAAFARLYFVFTVFSGGILGFSLANAVFVDQMTSDNVDKSEKKIDDLQNCVEDLKHHLLRIENLIQRHSDK